MIRMHECFYSYTCNVFTMPRLRRESLYRGKRHYIISKRKLNIVYNYIYYATQRVCHILCLVTLKWSICVVPWNARIVCMVFGSDFEHHTIWENTRKCKDVISKWYIHDHAYWFVEMYRGTLLFHWKLIVEVMHEEKVIYFYFLKIKLPFGIYFVDCSKLRLLFLTPSPRLKVFLKISRKTEDEKKC